MKNRLEELTELLKILFTQKSFPKPADLHGVLAVHTRAAHGEGWAEAKKTQRIRATLIGFGLLEKKAQRYPLAEPYLHIPTPDADNLRLLAGLIMSHETTGPHKQKSVFQKIALQMLTPPSRFLMQNSPESFGPNHHALQEAIEAQKSCTLRYRCNAQDFMREFEVEPYALRRFNHGWYLWAKVRTGKPHPISGHAMSTIDAIEPPELQPGDFKHFKLGCIERVGVWNETFMRDEAALAAYGESKSPRFNLHADRYEVTLRIAPELADYFRAVRDHFADQRVVHDEGAAGSLTLRISAGDDEEILHDIKAWMPYIQVLDRPALLQRIAQDAQKLLSGAQMDTAQLWFDRLPPRIHGAGCSHPWAEPETLNGLRSYIRARLGEYLDEAEAVQAFLVDAGVFEKVGSQLGAGKPFQNGLMGLYARADKALLSALPKVSNFKPGDAVVLLNPAAIEQQVKRLTSLPEAAALPNPGERLSKLVFAKVYLHELSHYIMDARCTAEPGAWLTLAEESLANAMLFSAAFTREERNLIAASFEQMDAAYQAAKAWAGYTPQEILDEAARWRQIKLQGNAERIQEYAQQIATGHQLGLPRLPDLLKPDNNEPFGQNIPEQTPHAWLALIESGEPLDDRLVLTAVFYFASSEGTQRHGWLRVLKTLHKKQGFNLIDLYHRLSLQTPGTLKEESIVQALGNVLHDESLRGLLEALMREDE